MKQKLGILGGMGPLASAEFLKTLYEVNSANIEQEMPTCFLYSDPTIPDRTEAIASGFDEVLISYFIEALERLDLFGVDKIVIPCITIHHFLPRVPLFLRNKIISLVDLILEEVLTRQECQLLLCTNGTLQGNIFQQHHLWSLTEEYIILPSDDEQNKIHNFIYQIKKQGINEFTMSFLDTLIAKHQVNSFIAGCTEIHLLTKHIIQNNYQHYHVIDPLLIMAYELGRFIELQTNNPALTTNNRDNNVNLSLSLI